MVNVIDTRQGMCPTFEKLPGWSQGMSLGIPQLIAGHYWDDHLSGMGCGAENNLKPCKNYACSHIEGFVNTNNIVVFTVPGDHGGVTKPFPDTAFAGDQTTPVDEMHPPVTVLQAETAPYVGVHSSNSVAIVAAVFMVILGSIMLLVVIVVVFGQRRKANETQNESM